LSTALLTQVNDPRQRFKTRSWSVPDAHYFRMQAELYLELSRRMSLLGDAEYCRVRAERCLATATELEDESARSPSASAPAISVTAKPRKRA
jgi:hypothetical protein